MHRCAVVRRRLVGLSVLSAIVGVSNPQANSLLSGWCIMDTVVPRGDIEVVTFPGWFVQITSSDNIFRLSFDSEAFGFPGEGIGGARFLGDYLFSHSYSCTP